MLLWPWHTAAEVYKKKLTTSCSRRTRAETSQVDRKLTTSCSRRARAETNHHPPQPVEWERLPAASIALEVAHLRLPYRDIVCRDHQEDTRGQALSNQGLH